MKKIISLLLALVLVLSACSVALADDVLRPGSKGTAVKTVQTLLKNYGYYTGKIDGKYGNTTTAAVRSFQKYNDLKVDGKVGSETLTVLKSGSAVSAPIVPGGSNSTVAVKNVQTLLKNLGYYTGKISGKYDNATVAAVKSFQKYNELKVDGKVGEDTLSRLSSSAAVPAPTSKKDSYSVDTKHIQERLQYYGYYTGKVDGIYGSGTIAAVKAFQKANSLTVDGAVGAVTLAKLDSSDAVSKADADRDTESAARPILRPGDKEAAKTKYIKEVQTILQSKGLYTGAIDGIYSGEIVTAVRVFQQQNSLTIDGRVGANTWKVLLGGTVTPVTPTRPSVLRPGDKNSYVTELQQQLISLGYSTVTASGTYDAATTSAVKAFQRKYALDIDGKVGPKTRAKINEVLGGASGTTTDSTADPDANG